MYPGIILRVFFDQNLDKSKIYSHRNKGKLTLQVITQGQPVAYQLLEYLDTAYSKMN
ncbi:hypothetical protein GXM_03972 [Nostoc sphaeroides CCNUC1]|uniref:Uncharacterized protein n=1 Tax=Nostoc sphaeroides CCNUC1 TaxID=2653204 RepID=A0A5P8W1L6_9NOSO|nr:hypothetical protein GXM_03972 [Nostoc sphaeroides CCNUC1]